MYNVHVSSKSKLVELSLPAVQCVLKEIKQELIQFTLQFMLPKHENFPSDLYFKTRGMGVKLVGSLKHDAHV